MAYFFDSKLHQPKVIQPPVNIIMAPKIIQEYILFGKPIDNIHLRPQQPDTSGCNCIPRSSHCSNIIKHMALRFFYCSKIRDYSIWNHDHFSEQQYSWTNNFTNHPENAYNRMNLRKVPAVRAKLLPNIRNCINSYNINSP